MSLVCRPQVVICDFEGYKVILRSDRPTENYEEFLKACAKLKELFNANT